MVSSKEAIAPTALKIRLRTALVVPFVLLIVAAVGLVGYLSLRNGQQAVNRLASQVRLEVASRTQQVMENYFSTPHQITHSNINALRLGQLKLQDKQAVERYFFYQLQTFPLLSELNVGTADGTMIYVGQKPDGSFIANTTAQFPRRERYELDNQGRRGKLVKVIEYDPRTRPWYKLGLQKRGQVWTEIYLFTTGQTLGMTAAEPYYDEQGKLVAVFTAQLPLRVLSDFLKTIKVSPTGQVFVLDRAGMLAATSTGENSLVEVNGEKQQLKAVDSKNLLTSRTTRYLQQHFGDLSQVKQLQELSFDIDGKRQDVLVQPYSDPKGLDFLVVVVVPEADFMEQINANTRTTIMLCLLALGLAIAVAIITANWISRPLKRIAKASRDMAGGNYDQQVASSQIIELEKLANSFNDMSWQLKNSFEKLNEVIVQANQVGLKVTSSTRQITYAGKQLEATVTQQAVSTNQVKATATSIAATSGQLAKTIEDIAQKAQATADQATNSQASLTEMAGAMHQLATATTLISTRLGILNENANNINSVVTTIAKVADQINLISLNAAIEAEKAGEYGVGFAVVAREVQRLADSTTVASGEIEQMVKDIQSSVGKGVKEMDKFSQQVSNHVKQVDRISGQIASVIFQ